MRMWGTPPNWMCRQHLLGEHLEMHMFIGTIKMGRSIRGYVEKGLVITSQIKQRHDLLVKEMKSRGYNHKSPLREKFSLDDGCKSRLKPAELFKRCSECRKRKRNHKKR